MPTIRLCANGRGLLGPSRPSWASSRWIHLLGLTRVILQAGPGDRPGRKDEMTGYITRLSAAAAEAMIDGQPRTQ